MGQDIYPQDIDPLLEAALSCFMLLRTKKHHFGVSRYLTNPLVQANASGGGVSHLPLSRFSLFSLSRFALSLSPSLSLFFVYPSLFSLCLSPLFLISVSVSFSVALSLSLFSISVSSLSLSLP